jgi:preprotein translocase subunit YajC
MIRTFDKVPIKIQVQTKDLQKYFENGESVRVISGFHAGGSGIITQISDKFAVVSMDGTKQELKILLANLKSKRDEMEHLKFDDFI